MDIGLPHHVITVQFQRKTLTVTDIPKKNIWSPFNYLCDSEAGSRVSDDILSKL